MRIAILPTGWQHSITADEIRAIITNPLLRFAITTVYPDANTYMFVGRINSQPWIEVGAEDVDGITWAVFHAMMLTAHVARDVYDLSSGTIDLRNDLPTQRPFIGPQPREEI